MSTPVTPTARNSTQQQLDDLDALLERMLNLPVNPAEEEPPPAPRPVAPPKPPVEARRPTPVPKPVPRTPPPVAGKEAPSAMPASVAETPLPPPAPARPIKKQPEQVITIKKQPEPAPAQVIVIEKEPDPPAPPTPPAAVEPPPTPPAPPAVTVRPSLGSTLPPDFAEPGLVRGTFLAVNDVFEHLTARLGPVGVWLRRRRVRSVLGWVGVGLLAASVGLCLLDWMRAGR